jgi:lipid-A-disaccharide synthase
MKYFIIAGEQSGDLHGSNLVKEIFRNDNNAAVECWGGDLMEKAGARLLMHFRNTAFMGFVTVLRNLGTIRRNFALCRSQITELKPDVVILIDYPGFNLRMARFAKDSGYRVFYYISPKLWAWNEKRVEKIKRFVDRIYIIFPFEKEFYKKHGIEAVYQGNPILDETEHKIKSVPSANEIRKLLGISDRPVISLLAGSRKSEVEHILPEMLGIVDKFPDYQFVLAGVKNLPDDLYGKIIGEKQVVLVRDKTYEVLQISEGALVASGTATLETALFNVPQVVCYRADFLSMLIAWVVIKVKFISLVNLIMEKEVVKELVQYDLNSRNLTSELTAILPGGSKRSRILDNYRELKKVLGEPGASGRVAADMVKTLTEKGLAGRADRTGLASHAGRESHKLKHD